MPEEGVKLSPPNAMFSTEEMVRVIQLFSRLGVNKLRFTGGEVRSFDAVGKS
jgi:molybdenum cofactor biosynthesis enzyme MoaA